MNKCYISVARHMVGLNSLKAVPASLKRMHQ